MRETGTGQQVAQLHDRYMMMMTKMLRAPTKEAVRTDIQDLTSEDNNKDVRKHLCVSNN
jgi:hypothetical protein